MDFERLHLMQRKGWLIALFGILSLLNFALMHFSGSTIWGSQANFAFPFFWLIAALILVIMLMKRWKSVYFYRLVGLLMLLIGQQYLVHSFQLLSSFPSLFAVVHFIAVGGSYLGLSLHFFNQSTPRINKTLLPLPQSLPHVVAIIATYNESVEILERTLLTLLQLKYPINRMSIMISDDGHRPSVRALALRYGVHYNYGAQRDAKAGNLNSALAYIQHRIPQAEMILTQDADELIDANFLQIIVPYFSDPKIAFVQTPKESIVPATDPFGTRDRVFYDRIQSGRNGDGAAFACGSGVMWRIAALQDIGGFATWNIVEDLTTSYYLHAKGWKSEYHCEILSVGLAPEDIPTLFKQRGTWAIDSWRLFLFDSPLTKPGLSFLQRLHYLETGLSYASSVIFTPMLMILPIISTLSGVYLPIDAGALLSWMVVHSLLFVLLAGGNLNHFYRMRQFWDGQFILNMRAFWIALRLRDRKPAYKVTLKGRLSGFYGHLVLPQFTYIVVATWSIFHNLLVRTDLDLGMRLSNVMIALYFIIIFLGVCAASLHGVERIWFFRPAPGKATQQRINADLIRVAPPNQWQQFARRTHRIHETMRRQVLNASPLRQPKTSPSP
jgi:cellulose synthase (UDP-forming)